MLCCPSCSSARLGVHMEPNTGPFAFCADCYTLPIR